MNISIPYSWIKDYVKTNASANEVAELLSLHSFSVEKITKVDGDDIFEIEVTPNRGDALSVLGVARELRALLPKKGFKCEWIEKNISVPGILKGDKNYEIEVDIRDKNLVPRFSAIILKDVKFGRSPKIIEERLEKVGIRPLGNVIDVTNYMMIDKGQPMHVFDYDKILGHKMIVRESKDGEVVTTLDGVERKLPKGVIVIEDGDGRLIDLCGIMGAKNSEVDENTKNILLFVQVYDPIRIRKASMSLGHRTEAALRFEKGIDFDGVIPALWESVNMISEFSGAKVCSDVIDIVNIERKEKYVEVSYDRINQIAGIDISNGDVDKYLMDLGFEKKESGNKVEVKIPSWRYDDIDIIEDLAEEVIRMYGYYNLPDKLLIGEIPVKEKNNIFHWESVAKCYLKHHGFFECYTYSATVKENVSEDALEISNPLSEDLLYLKTSLIPQLFDVVERNKGYSEKIKIFELASVYLRKKSNKDNIPDQPLMLGLVTKGMSEFELKGVVEGMLNDFGIFENIEFEIRDLGEGVLGVELNFDDISKNATKTRTYVPLTSFNSIKEDLTFEIPECVLYQTIEKIILGSDNRIYKLVFKDIYKKSLTFSIEYLDKKRQISSVDTQEIRKKIFTNLEKINVKLKG